jgi:predicted DNA-binding transcriptional regulator AlpA
MPKIESEWLGGAQTAVYLGVTAMTIWRWQRDPRLAFPASTIIHGRKYWSRSDIDTWMRRMASGKASPTRTGLATQSDLTGGPLAEGGSQP